MKSHEIQLRIEPGLSYDSIQIMFEHVVNPSVMISAEETEFDSLLALLRFAQIILPHLQEIPKSVLITEQPNISLELRNMWMPSRKLDVVLHHTDRDYHFQLANPVKSATNICDAVQAARSIIEAEIANNGWRHSFPLDELHLTKKLIQIA